jgi:hypothetical protein
VADIYTPIVYVDGPGGGTPLSAANVNHTEEGIDDLDSVVQDIADDVAAIRAGLGSPAHPSVRKGTTAERAAVRGGGDSTSSGTPTWTSC